jgi:hypothetical protein
VTCADSHSLGAGEWRACENPERPPDAGVVYYTRCPRCAIALEAVANTHPDHRVWRAGVPTTVAAAWAELAGRSVRWKVRPDGPCR